MQSILKPNIVICACLGISVLLTACGDGLSKGVLGNTNGVGDDTGNNPGAAVAAIVQSPSIASIGTSLAQDACGINYTVSAYLGSPSANSDPLRAQAWHLKNTGSLEGSSAGEDINAEPAWSLSQGSGVRVAIVDSGVEITHEDLVANLVPFASYNYFTKGPWPLPCFDTDDDAHGTAVTGLIVARADNGKGSLGVAPQAQFVAYNALASTDGDLADSLVRGAQVNHVYHNSWGSDDNGFLQPASAAIEAAINSGINSGRSGKGSVYVFSGGNGREFLLANGFLGSENSNYDGVVNKLGVITVCAVDGHGKQTWYSESGANLMVCAPAHTAISGVLSSSLKNSYSSDFDGTSFTAPLVSGVAALMLSANPNLTWRDVRLLFAKTARKNDPTDADWSTLNGYNFNHKYGFGVVDAYAAVLAAKTWTSVGNSSTLKQCDSGIRSVNLAIADATETLPGAATLAKHSFGSDCAITQIEFIEVTVSTQHAYPGDLQIRLLSPSATASVLAESRFCSRDTLSDAENPCLQNFASWRFGSNRHIAETARGEWSLELRDMTADDIGSLTSWGIKIWGR